MTERYIVNPPLSKKMHGQHPTEKTCHGAVSIGPITVAATIQTPINTYLRMKMAPGHPALTFLITEIDMATKFIDVGFYILLPETAAVNFELRQDSVNWGGELHPQGDPYYAAGKNIHFREVPVKGFFLKYLPDEYENLSWKMYLVDEKCLCMLKDQLAGMTIEWQGMGFEEFIKAILLSSSIWAVFFLKNQDGIDASYCLSVDSLSEKIVRVLSPENSIEGFVAYSNS